MLALAIGGQIKSQAATVYWDINGTTAEAGGSTPSGNWSTNSGVTNRNWSTSSAGTAVSSSWTDGDSAIFSAGSDANGSFTATLSKNDVTAAGITVEDGGTLTIAGAYTLILSSSATINTATTLTINSAATVSGGLTITGGGTVAFNSTLDFTGDLTLDGSTLALSGTTITIGTLNITGNSVIDFGGATTINVGTLNIASGATLTITNWTNAVDYFYATSFPGTTPDILGNGTASRVSFAGWSNGTKWTSVGNEVTPVPEPSSYGAIFLGLAGCGYLWRRRGKK
jgi:hypothetical protein